MAENEDAQQPIVKPKGTVIFITVAFWVIIIACTVASITNRKAGTDIALLCNLTLSLLVILNYRIAGGFLRLFVFNPKDSPLIIFFPFFYFVGTMPLFRNFITGNMQYINAYIVVVAIAIAAFFTCAILYKNENFEKYHKDGIPYKVLVIFLALIAGYSFALLLNCCELVGRRDTYATSLQSKYVKIEHGKGGPFKVYHFVVNDWPYSNTFGNDFIGVPVDSSGTFAGINDIQTGDTIYIKVHEGILGLPWMEAQEFKPPNRQDI